MKLAVGALLAWVLVAQLAWLQIIGGEMALAWTLHAGVALLLCQPGLHFRRLRRWQTAAALGVLLAWWPWMAPFVEERLPPAKAPELTLLSANTYHHNPQIEELAAELDRSNADLLALMEPDVRLFDRLPSYRLLAAEKSGDKYGIALLLARSSELTAATATVAKLAFTPAPLITAELRWRGRPLRAFAIHALAPTNLEQTSQHGLQIDDLMRRVETSTIPAIVFGDFNMVVASPAWRRLRAHDRLRRPPGWTPSTWPWQLGPIGLAIDHILMAPCFSATPLEPVHLPGSDHRGVRTRAAW